MTRRARFPLTITPVLVGLAMPVTGCATNAFQSALDLQSSQGIDVITRNPELDAVIVRGSGAQAKSCASPETDAVPVDNFGFSGDVDVTTGGTAEEKGAIGLDGGAGTQTLGGLTPSVLMAREILFRTCEFTVNQDLNQADATELFKAALDKVSTLTTTMVTATGTAPTTAAETAAAPSLPGN